MSALTKTAGFGLVAAVGLAAYNFGGDAIDAVRFSGSSNQNQPTATPAATIAPPPISSNTTIMAKKLTFNDPSTGTNEEISILSIPLPASARMHNDAITDLFTRARKAEQIESTTTFAGYTPRWAVAGMPDGLSGKKIVISDITNAAFDNDEAMACVAGAARIAEQDAPNFSESTAYRLMLNPGKTDLGKQWVSMVRDINEDTGYVDIDLSQDSPGDDMKVIYDCAFPTPP